jgi:hypothetical protein
VSILRIGSRIAVSTWERTLIGKWFPPKVFRFPGWIGSDSDGVVPKGAQSGIGMPKAQIP